MLLAIDVGNTQTHIGTFDGEALTDHWRYATEPEATVDELAMTVSGLLGLRGTGFAAIGGCTISSVVPQLGSELREMAERYIECPSLVVEPGVKTGIAILIDNPLELGADRLVNAVAGYERCQGPCVVVDFGTAITFDAVSGDGEYLGGVIAPGVEISMEALTQRGARLPRIELEEPRTLIGKSTQASIQSGVIYGFAGQVDGITGRLKRELGEDTRAIATGGLAAAIVPFTETIDELDDLLTLNGLRLIWERNR